MILMIDNYDSFTWNLVQYFGELGAEVKVVLNDEVTVDEITAMKPEKIVISPGPCSPNEAGISLAAISAFAGKLPILGVCLGHQALGQVFGGKVVHAKTLMHGKTSPVMHAGTGVFTGLPSPFTATRYHSLAVHQRLGVHYLAAEGLAQRLMAEAHAENRQFAGEGADRRERNARFVR